MKTILPFFLLFLFINISNSQSLENIKVGLSYDLQNEKLVGENFWFKSNEYEKTPLCYQLWQEADFNELSLTVRIIKLKNGIEQIYSSEELAVEPSWNRTINSIELPKGEFAIKVYNKANQLIGYSHPFIVY